MTTDSDVGDLISSYDELRFDMFGPSVTKGAVIATLVIELLTWCNKFLVVFAAAQRVVQFRDRFSLSIRSCDWNTLLQNCAR